MKRTMLVTEDGSHSLYVPDLQEIYHSTHGAIQESEFVYIQTALTPCQHSEIRIFELGFGTGLNALLALQYAMKHSKKLKYFAIELFPLEPSEYQILNYPTQLNLLPDDFQRMHTCSWDTPQEINPYLTLTKFHADITKFNIDFKFDVCFFDAFSPTVQPELWTLEQFQKIFNQMNTGGILSTYSSKGEIRRRLQQAGFQVERLKGPPGKREMLRAIKNEE